MRAGDEATRQQLHRDLRGLGFLESAQQVLALVALVGIALHAIVESQDLGTQLFLSSALVLALVYQALAFRIRLGADLVRRDLWQLEAGHASDAHVAAGAPYRSMPLQPELRPRASRSLRLASYAAVAALASGATLACVAMT